MTSDDLLDQILIPRPNGSDGLIRVASFIEATLRRNGADVTLQPFTATPYGFRLLFAIVFVMMLGSALAVLLRRYRLALLLALLAPIVLLAETEFLRSPLSGLLPVTEHNIVGEFAGAAGGPTLLFSAHYDSTTHFGDHVTWSRWSPVVGLGTLTAIVLPVVGLARRRRGRAIPLSARLTGALVMIIPFAGLAWFFALGPFLRIPSPGALDNGGSVVVLLRLAEHLAARPAGAPSTVKLVFLAAEEERALGSWSYARTLAGDGSVWVVNLEMVGAGDGLAYLNEEGFMFTRYPPAAPLIELINATARQLWGAPLPAVAFPDGAFTDGRSFLAHGIPTATILADGPFPRHLHSINDSRDRVSIVGLERAVDLLADVVARVDRDPGLLTRRSP